jgi:hypothetical protein
VRVTVVDRDEGGEVDPFFMVSSSTRAWEKRRCLKQPSAEATLAADSDSECVNVATLRSVLSLIDHGNLDSHATVAVVTQAMLGSLNE